MPYRSAFLILKLTSSNNRASISIPHSGSDGISALSKLNGIEAKLIFKLIDCGALEV